MKKVYFVQVGFGFDGSVYLPYAVGTIIANCLRYPEITTEYEFPDIIFRREKLADALEKISAPDLVAFSCSVWNMEYNKALAKRVRSAYPNCLIAFGGHNVKADGSLLETEPYIDLLTYGEGEETFASLLRALPAGDLSRVPSIAYRENGEIRQTPPAPLCDLNELPSPYLTHVFDSIMARNPSLEFLSVIETNRGCPYRCAYCDWVTAKKMRFFPLEKVKAEIRWLGEHKIAYCFCGDSNFGMFERDVEIAEYLVQTKRTYGYPEVFRPCYEKNSADRVFRICSILNREGMDKGATLAYQTLSPAALKNIGRQNLTMEHFSALVRRYNEAGIPAYSELILGLPGETKESFCRGICRLFENGQHNSVSVYHCEMLPNSEMADPAYIERYGIRVIRVAFNHIHSAPEQDEEVMEYSYLVRATAAMPPEDWVYANLFSICVQCFHSLGVLRFFAMALHALKKVSYYDFYTGLLTYIFASGGRLRALWDSFKTKYETSLAGDWNYHNAAFGHVTWFFEEGAFLEILNDYDAFQAELLPFLRRFGLPEDLFEDLARYQKMILRKPAQAQTRFSFSWDLPRWFGDITAGRETAPEKKNIRLRLVPNKTFPSFPVYARETVWYGRRRGASVYGRTELLYETEEAT